MGLSELLLSSACIFDWTSPSSSTVFFSFKCFCSALFFFFGVVVGDFPGLCVFCFLLFWTEGPSSD